MTDKGTGDKILCDLDSERYAVVHEDGSVGNMSEAESVTHLSLEGTSGAPAMGSGDTEGDGYFDNIVRDGELERVLSDLSVGGAHDNEKPSLIPNESRFNPIEYLIGSLNEAMSSLESDKTLVVQSKMAGNLNNATSEVLKMISDLQESLEEHIVNYESLKSEVLPELEANLRLGTDLVEKITAYMKDVYPVEYAKGRSKVLENLTEDEEGLYL